MRLSVYKLKAVVATLKVCLLRNVELILPTRRPMMFNRAARLTTHDSRTAESVAQVARTPRAFCVRYNGLLESTQYSIDRLLFACLNPSTDFNSVKNATPR